MKRHAAILVGLAAGLVLGVAAWATEAPALVIAVRVLEPVGAIFVNLLRMAVIPLVATALYAGVARLGDPRRLGRLALRALAFFWTTTVIAIAIGFASARVILPLAPIPDQRRAELRAQAPDADLLAASSHATRSGVDFLVDMIPRNPVGAAARGELLPLVVFSLIAALATAALPQAKRQVLVDLADGATQALIRIVYWALALAPFGVAGLIAPVTMQLGWRMLGVIGAFVAAVLLGLAVFAVGVYLPVMLLRRGTHLGTVLREGAPAIAMGFSSTSSLAALPLLMEAAEDRLCYPRAVSGLVIPLGVSLNRSGSALYQGVALLFLADLYGVAIPLGGYLAALAAVFLAALTIAAVPSASVLSLAPALTATGVPLAGLGILLGVDRIPDMFRTSVNVGGTLLGTAFVASGEAVSDAEPGSE